jgi:hypothetical protein
MNNRDAFLDGVEGAGIGKEDINREALLGYSYKLIL